MEHLKMKQIPMAAAQWAVSKKGCNYSQAKRMYENIFDCSSLVARAYVAAGKEWGYRGPAPISMNEVYDDDFELIWPATYEEIGKVLGGSSQILLARQPGDLQFLCTDQRTKRHNRITHVTMVADENQIVHARGVNYGVCLNHIGTYDGKVCALTRYNPQGTLRIGMCGKRTLALQKALNRNGADLNEDGEFGEKTQAAVIEYQIRYDMEPTGQADRKTLFSLGLLEKEPDSIQLIRVTGERVNLRHGPGTEYSIADTVERGEVFAVPDTEGWRPILTGNTVRWISEKYITTA